MIECPECGYEIDEADYEIDEDDYEIDEDDGPLDIEGGAEAILKGCLPGFSLGDRLILEEAIRRCLVERLGVSPGTLCKAAYIPAGPNPTTTGRFSLSITCFPMKGKASSLFLFLRSSNSDLEYVSTR